MKYKFIFALILFSVAAFLLASLGCASQMSAEPAPEPSPATSAAKTPPVVVSSVSDEVFDGVKVVKSDAEWRSLLSPEAYHILREEGTERAFSGEYDKNKKKGFYHCAACHLKLFDSATKFDSGTGWPSFYQPINAKNVVEKSDTAFGITRTEIECARCGSHLGHVFDDGPKPTGLRYCMNSPALKFEPAR